MDTKNIQNEILEKIKSGKVKKRPHWYFMLRTMFVTGALFLCFFIAAYLGSFFDLVVSEHEFGKVAALGPQGFLILTQTLPWLIVASLFIVLFATHFLVRYFAFAYQKPVLYTLLIIIFATFIILEIIKAVDPGRGFAKLGERNLFMGMHDRYRSGVQGELVHGIVKNVDGNILIIESARSSSTIKVIIDEKTHNSDELESLSENSPVFVVAEKISNDSDHLHAIFLDDKPVFGPEKRK